ncbi:GumC family protein [Aurantiacibacter sp. D1-12]|uniref:GumC family protein n=1 Tax=Aurantiacibacter sp. D1-12 TaxID=2993658 RepID=UPI00237C7056|nr:polysaccharide biosynthesis tyrosine autokinase [Aurantiacibacter sp. D1-12]MDE1466889.1 polysaccharide biosynthesis tyrosine autokinase [Aurantiacibacter sp. D1-12]
MNQNNAAYVSSDDTYLAANENSRSTLLLKIWQTVVSNRWLVLAIILVSIALATIFTLLTTPLYTSEARVQIDRLEANISSVEGVEASAAQLRYDEFYSTQYALLESQSLAERVSRSLNLPADEAFLEAFEISEESAIVVGEPATANERVGQLLLSRLEITPVRGSSLVDVTFTSPDPRLSARILRAWLDEFIETNVERRYSATGEAREILEGRLADLRERLEDSERQLVTYATNTGIFAISGAGAGGTGSETASADSTLIGTELSNMNRSLTQARQDRIAAESQMRAGPTAPSAVIQTLQSSKAQLEAERASLLTQFEEGYPPVRALTAQIAELDQEIAEARSSSQGDLQRAYQAALAREQGLEAQVRGLQGEYLTEQNAIIQYNILRREVSTNRELYDALLQRYKEIGVASVEASNVTVVDVPRIPTGRSSPNLFLNLLLGLFGGAVAAGLVLLAKEQVDHSLRDLDDVPRDLGLPVLGAVPRQSHDFLVEDLRDPRSGLAEAYLSVGTMLDLSTANGVPSTLMFTSSAAHEGKTISSYAVARHLARSGKKTVLVDLDLRSPSIANRLDIDSSSGTSAILTGQATVEEVLHRDYETNLSVITVGAVPPNPGELISSGNIDRLYTELRKEFDHVVVDAPPVMALSDAPVLASRTGGVVFVIEANRLRIRQLQAALGRLRHAHAHILGAVITKLDQRNTDYGYGGDYGYDYGSDDDEDDDSADRAPAFARSTS